MSVHRFHFFRWVGRVTKREFFALAVEAFAAGDHWADNDPISHFEVFDFGSNFFHDTDGFMTHDQAFLHRAVHLADVHM